MGPEETGVHLAAARQAPARLCPRVRPQSLPPVPQGSAEVQGRGSLLLLSKEGPGPRARAVLPASHAQPEPLSNAPLFEIFFRGQTLVGTKGHLPAVQPWPSHTTPCPAAQQPSPGLQGQAADAHRLPLPDPTPAPSATGRMTTQADPGHGLGGGQGWAERGSSRERLYPLCMPGWHTEVAEETEGRWVTGTGLWCSTGPG